MKMVPQSSQKKKKSQAQELRTANKFGGITQPGSGSSWAAKGDVKTDLFLIENKYTEAASFSITVKTWNKIVKEAAREQRLPMMQVDIAGEQLAVIRVKDLLNL